MYYHGRRNEHIRASSSPHSNDRRVAASLDPRVPINRQPESDRGTRIFPRLALTASERSLLMRVWILSPGRTEAHHPEAMKEIYG
jgi:hypothetical protein